MKINPTKKIVNNLIALQNRVGHYPLDFLQPIRTSKGKIDNGAEAIGRYTTHLKRAIKNPTVSLIAEHDIFKEETPAWQSFKELYPIHNDLLKELDKRIQMLYPKTYKIRKFLIENDYFTLEKVGPIKENHIATYFKYFAQKLGL